MALRDWKNLESTDHACRVCFGRVFSGVDKDGRAGVICSICETSAAGGHQNLCCCGVKLRRGVSAGLRCVKNPDVSPEVPATIIVKRVEDAKNG